MVAEQVSDPQNSTRLLRSQGNKTSMTSAPPVPRRVTRIWTIVHEHEHEESFLQSDDEIAMKVMINKSSTLLSVVTTGKAPIKRFGSQKTSECSDRPSFALLSGFYTDRQRKEGEQAWSNDRLHPGRVLHEQEARHHHRCTRAQKFHSEHDHQSVAGRQPNHLDACTQNSSPSSCRVHTKRGIC